MSPLVGLADVFTTSAILFVVMAGLAWVMAEKYRSRNL